MVMKKELNGHSFFQGLLHEITLMYDVDFYSLFNYPEKDWESLLKADIRKDV